MLRLTNRLPAQEARDIVGKILDSKVAWVRTQALEVAASISSSLSASPLPVEVANAYGDGSIIGVIKSRLSIAYKTGSKGLALVSTISFLLFLFHIFVISLATQSSALDISNNVAYGGLYSDTLYSISKQTQKNVYSENEAAIKKKELENVAILYQDLVSTTIPAAIIVAIIGSLIWAPKYFWAIIPASGSVSLIILSVIFSLWLYAPHATIENVFEDAFKSIFTGVFWIGFYSFIWISFAAATTFLFATILATSIYLWSKNRSHFFSTYKAIYYNSGYIEYIAIFGSLWFAIIGLLAFGLAIKVIEWVYRWLTNPTHWWVEVSTYINNIVPDISYLNRFFDYAIVGLLLLSGISLIWTFISLISKGKNGKLIEYFETPLVTIGLSIVIILFGEFFSTIEEKPKKTPVEESAYSITGVMEVVVFALIIIMIISIFVALIFMAYKILRRYSPSIDIMPTKIDINKFESIIKSKNSDEQTRILKKLNLTELNISPNDFYSLLIELEPYVAEEPALSRYYQKRIELEEILRQERQG